MFFLEKPFLKAVITMKLYVLEMAFGEKLLTCSIPGFWTSADCSSQSSGNVDRLFDIDCDPLTDLPDKKLFLRQFDENFLIGSKASFDCLAGHQLSSKVSLSVVHCLITLNSCLRRNSEHCCDRNLALLGPAST